MEIEKSRLSFLNGIKRSGLARMPDETDIALKGKGQEYPSAATKREKREDQQLEREEKRTSIVNQCEAFENPTFV
jgi:hypothetical protein